MLNKTKKALAKLLEIEEQRDTFARRRDFAALMRTYKFSVSQRNGNTGKFWDDKFTAIGGEGSYPSVEKDRNGTAYRWFRNILQTNMHVLNIGCGNGRFEYEFDQDALPPCYYEGMDFAQKTIDELTMKFPKYYFWKGDIVKDGLKKKYDIFCIFEVLEHISDRDTFSVLKKLFNSLNQDGFMMVAVPLNEPLMEMYPSNPNEHVRHYTKELICAELELAGFTIIKTQEFVAFSSHYFLKKLLSKTILRNRWKPNDLLILVQKS